MKDYLPDHIDNLLKQYEHNAVLKGLIQLVPFGIGSFADSAILAHAGRLRAERTRVFFEELASGARLLTPELVDNDEFLHCFTSTSSAALRTHRHEKIRAFARMLLSSVSERAFSNIDEFEEYLRILDELSIRELAILQTLENYETAYPNEPNENALGRANKYWDKFTDDVVTKLRVPKGEFDAMMTRLNRTGCYETFTGGFYDYAGGQGQLTQTYYRLKSIIERHCG